MQRSLVNDEKKSENTLSAIDQPLNSTASINLLVHIVALSKFFLKKETIHSQVHEKAADHLIISLCQLDIDKNSSLSKKMLLSHGFVTMAKADLFPTSLLHPSDYEAMKPCGLLSPKPKGENVASYLLTDQIYGFIETHVNKKYRDDLKAIIELATTLSVIGFASYNLLNDRRQFDKAQELATEYDPQNTLASQKSNIIKLISTLSGRKSKTTHSGDISNLQQLIAADVDQIRNKFEAIELDIVKKDRASKQMQIHQLLPAVVDKLQDSKITEEKITTQLQKNIAARQSKSREDLLQELKEQDDLQAKLTALLTKQNNELIKRATETTKHRDVIAAKYTIENKELKDINQKISKENEDLHIQMESSNQALDHVTQELYDLKQTTPFWHYVVAGALLVLGTALLATGIGGIIAGATALSYIAVVLGGAAVLSSCTYTAKKIHNYLTTNNQKTSDLDPPNAPLLPIRHLTLPKHKTDLLVNSPSLTYPLLSPTPLFSRTFSSKGPKLLSEHINEEESKVHNPYKKLG